MKDILIRAALAGGLLLAVVPASAEPAEKGAADAGAEGRLAERADLDTILQLALQRNPDLKEAGERITSARERADVAGGLPDPELRYQLWNAPFSKPLSPEMHMLGLSQSFPAPGSRKARTEAGKKEAQLAQQGRRARAEDIATQVRRAYFEYYRADRQLKIHRDHLEISGRIVELARTAYQTGSATQQDVLRAAVEVSRIQTDLASVGQQRQSAAAMLNALMDREQDAPLGPPADLAVPAQQPALEELARSLDSQRPEIAAAGEAIGRSESLLKAAENEANRPGFMVGADYMYAPAVEADGHAAATESMHGFGVMLSMTLPWVNGSRDAGVREARASLAADREAQRAAQVASRYQLRDAAARYEAAKKTHDVIENELMPLARRSYEAAEAGFVAGKGGALELLDAERSWLQVRLDRERAVAQLMSSLADLQRAAGTATSELSRGTEDK